MARLRMGPGIELAQACDQVQHRDCETVYTGEKKGGGSAVLAGVAKSGEWQERNEVKHLGQNNPQRNAN